MRFLLWYSLIYLSLSILFNLIIVLGDKVAKDIQKAFMNILFTVPMLILIIMIMRG